MPLRPRVATPTRLRRDTPPASRLTTASTFAFSSARGTPACRRARAETRPCISGGSASIGLAVGGAVTDNLIIYGTFTGTTISNPNLTFNGVSMSNTNTSADSFGFGAGVAYYLEPSNVYFAGSILANQLQIDDTDGTTTATTQWGLGLEGIVGKEWWVSDNWGLGVAGQVLWASMKDKTTFDGTLGTPPTWTSTAFSLLFSATYN